MRWLLLLITLASAEGQSRSSKITAAVDSWSKNTGVALTAGARGKVLSQTMEGGSTFEQFLRAQKDQDVALNRSVRNYCFELRDTAGKGAKSIDEKTVDRLPFASFIERFLLPFSDRPVGYLEVRSTPGEGDIQVDDKRRGYTNKLFVVSGGTHEVRVTWGGTTTSCWQRVQVSAGETERVQCAQK